MSHANETNILTSDTCVPRPGTQKGGSRPAAAWNGCKAVGVDRAACGAVRIAVQGGHISFCSPARWGCWPLAPHPKHLHDQLPSMSNRHASRRVELNAQCRGDRVPWPPPTGALDWRHFSGYDSIYDISYMLGAIGIIGVAGVMYRNLYASDPGWVQPGSKMDVPTRPLCQYCMVRPPMRSRHCFLSGEGAKCMRRC